MLTEIRIYFEGSGLLKSGFASFFEELVSKAASRNCRISFISADSGPEACEDFDIALRKHPKAWNMLLKDSEGPYTDNLATSLCHKYKWSQSHAESIFWMVEMMESWFHADKAALKGFYGAGFKPNALRPNPKVEEISKRDLEDGLQKATKGTKKLGYFDNKTLHGPKLLALIDPKLVRVAAPNCDKLFIAVLAKIR